MRNPRESATDDSPATPRAAAARWPARAARALLGAATLLLTGCATLGYYGQAALGQAEILLGRRSLANAMADPATPPATRAKLALAADARRFATTALALPDNPSYLRYTDLGRPFVVWNVFAAPALSLEPVRSCFPVVGCLDYRGYFREHRAREHARDLAAAGNDVYVGGVAAYSTLGWFADPLLSTMLAWDDRRLVTTIFHELAHQQVYVRDDTTFNESFAMAVAELGYARWRAARGEPVDGDGDAGKDAALVELLIRHRTVLDELYRREDLDDERKLALKQAQFAVLAEDWAALRARWQGDARYDEWMSTDMNNAKLASIATYHELVPGFRALFQRADGDFASFYARVEALGRLDATVRVHCLEAWAAGGEPTDCGS
jgi:predicted aminopeptidase